MKGDYKYKKEYLHRKLKQKKTVRVNSRKKTLYMGALRELSALEDAYVKTLLSRDNYVLQYEIE